MSPRDQLSQREIQVATMVWEGKTNPEIAAVLGGTEQVVKNQLRGIFDKLGVWSRLELALYVASHGGSAWATGALAATNATRQPLSRHALPSHHLRQRAIAMLSMYRRRNSSVSPDTSVKHTPLPKPGEVLTTCPFNRSLVSPSQSAIAKPVPTSRGIGISTKQPPTLRSEAFPQITGWPARRNSTEIEHFTRRERLRSTVERKSSTAIP
jgi:DNA-binding CsgD family transcriptional regulator